MKRGDLKMTKSVSVSFKQSGKKYSVKHNMRTKNQMLNGEVKNGDGHIDSNRTDLNVKLENGTLLGTYKKLFGKSLEEYNDKQKRDDRKIPNMRAYLGSIEHNPRKRAEYEVIMQVGEKGDLDDLSLDQTNKLLTNVYNNFKEAHPQFEIFSAVIHNDEATPHLHLKFVPYAKDYTRGLSVQPSFRKACDQMGIRRDMRDYSEIEHDRIAKEVKKELGYDRKLVGTHDYVEPEQFRKGIKENEEEVAKLKEQVNSLTSSLKDLRSKSSETAEQLKLYSKHLKYVKKQACDKWGIYKDEISKRFDELNDPDKKMEWLQATSDYNEALRNQNLAKKMFAKGGLLNTALATGIEFINKRKRETAQKQIDDMNAERDRIKNEIQLLKNAQMVEATMNTAVKKSLITTVNKVGSTLNQQNADAKALNKGLKNVKEELKDTNEAFTNRYLIKNRFEQLETLAEKVPDVPEGLPENATDEQIDEKVTENNKQLFKDTYQEELDKNLKQEFNKKGIIMSDDDIEAIKDNEVDKLNIDASDLEEIGKAEAQRLASEIDINSLTKQNGMQR